MSMLQMLIERIGKCEDLLQQFFRKSSNDEIKFEDIKSSMFKYDMDYLRRAAQNTLLSQRRRAKGSVYLHLTREMAGTLKKNGFSIYITRWDEEATAEVKRYFILWGGYENCMDMSPYHEWSDHTDNVAA